MAIQIYYQNVRGLRSKTRTVYCASFQCDFDIFCLTETFLNDGVFDGELFCDEYEVYRRDRSSSASDKTDGGGVLIAIRKNFSATLLTDMCSDAEDLWISVSWGDFRLLLCCVYLPPDDLGAAECFFRALESVGENYPNSTILVCGDFNIPRLSWEASVDGSLIPSGGYDIRSRLFLNTFSYSNLFQFNNIQNAKSRILDLVVTNRFCIRDVARCLSSLVDEDNHHPSIIVTLTLSDPRPLKRATKKKYFFNRGDYDSINNSLKSINWDNVLASLGTDLSVSLFYNTIWPIIDEFVPHVTVTGRNYPTWFSQATIKCVKEKRKFHKKWKMYANKVDYLTFALLRARSKRLIECDYREYVASMEDSISRDPKRVWSFVSGRRRGASRIPDTVKSHDDVATNGESICNMFSNYFHSVFVDGGSDLETDGPGDAGEHNVPTFFEPGLILDRLRELVPSTGTGPDGIPNLFLRNCAEGLVIPLNIIFTRSLREGRCPSRWKKAFVIPIFKSGDRALVQNYRPISILSSVSKVFESLIYKVLLHDVKNKIVPQQHGFFPGRSVETNLCAYTEFILKSLDTRTQVDAIYTDFSKAFDKIDHTILINKLRVMELDECLIRWLATYITGRSQAVRINDFVSSYRNVPSGVAQGSHIGPLLFSIYVNDMSSCFRHSNFLMYADDTKIFATISSVQDCVNLQSDLDRLHNYCVVNKLNLNYDKCHKITFSRNRYTFNFNYSFSENILTSVASTKDLGVVIDSKLLFDLHITRCTQKAFRALGFVIRLSSSFSSLSTINALYNSYVCSVLSFASVVWNPQYQIYADRVESVQKRYLRYLSRKFYLPSCPYEQQCRIFNLVPLWKRRRFQDATFLYKIINGCLDVPDLLSLFAFHAPNRTVRSVDLLHSTLCHTNSFQNSPVNRLVSSYNRHFDCIDPFHVSLSSFKRRLRAID